MKRNKYILLTVLIFCLLVSTTITLEAVAKTTPRAVISLSPENGEFIVGSNFTVGVFLNTYGESINTISLDIKFPADKLAIIKPSGDKSMISIWVEPPSFSNTLGTMHLAGIIQNGIIADNSLITNITFRALAPRGSTYRCKPKF